MPTLPVIVDYTFGRMTIQDHTYTSDLVILPDGTVLDNWFRRQGHLLILSDITRLLEPAPAQIVIGTGTSGRMTVDPSLTVHCDHLGIQTKISPSNEAVRIYNSLIGSGKSLGACFHLTC